MFTQCKELQVGHLSGTDVRQLSTVAVSSQSGILNRFTVVWSCLHFKTVEKMRMNVTHNGVHTSMPVSFRKRNETKNKWQ